jgi:phosphomannomutase/phosphoglucomutase
MPAPVSEAIFRAYDIRGRVADQITPEVVNRIARAYATRFSGRDGATLVVGQDLRPSSPALAEAAIEGILSTGVNVVDVGQAPTPGLYFAIGLWGHDGGMGITASHRPPEDNGIKVRMGDGPFFGDDLQALKHEVLAGDFATGQGNYEKRDLYPEYFRIATQRVTIHRPMRVALDVGNGCGTLTAPRLLRELGCEVHTLFEEPDGTFPGRGPDPLAAGALQPLRELMGRVQAEIGIAIDADGDRIAVVDVEGNTVEPDQYMIPVCRDALRAGPATIVSEVRCSQSIVDDIRAHGGDVDLVACGYPFILQAMGKHNSPVGFETTGHCYFNDPYFKFDDASFGAARLLSTLSVGEDRLHEIVASAPVYYPADPPRVPCPDSIKWDVVAAVADSFRAEREINEVDGVRVQYEDGWSVLRASNTGEELVMRWEGNSPRTRDRIGEDLQRRLQEAIRRLGGS